jgi:hypothetical protein
LKTVDIPLFQNLSLEPNVADNITIELGSQITSKGQLKLANGRGDATLSGKVTLYENKPYTFDATGTREVDINQYMVKLTADIEFFDNVKNSDIYKGTVTGEGIYSFKTENENIGKEKATKDIVARILENLLQGW